MKEPTIEELRLIEQEQLDEDFDIIEHVPIAIAEPMYDDYSGEKIDLHEKISFKGVRLA